MNQADKGYHKLQAKMGPPMRVHDYIPKGSEVSYRCLVKSLAKENNS